MGASERRAALGRTGIDRVQRQGISCGFALDTHLLNQRSYDALFPLSKTYKPSQCFWTRLDRTIVLAQALWIFRGIEHRSSTRTGGYQLNCRDAILRQNKYIIL